MPEQKQTTGTKAAPSKADAKAAETLPKEEQDELLEEALEETFPASDPMSSMHFTSPTKKPD